MNEPTSRQKNRYTIVLSFGLFYLIISGIMRIALICQTGSQLSAGVGGVTMIIVVGTLNDLMVTTCLITPLMIYLALMPRDWLIMRWHRVTLTVILSMAVYGLLFTEAAEWFFWDEFATRFNFIAVDYLVYTNEVIGNIHQSYPLGLILSGIALLTTLIMLGLWKYGGVTICDDLTMTRTQLVLPPLLLIAACVGSSVGHRQITPNSTNTYLKDLAYNGIASFVGAYFDNELDYQRFYVTKDKKQMGERLREMVAQDNTGFVDDDPTSIRRYVNNPEPEHRWNVIQITVESLSKRYINPALTPALYDLCQKSLYLDNLRATGTRTVRGMEALTLSMPPTPGRSIVKREFCGPFFNIGTVFQKRGYDTVFLYGGHGYLALHTSGYF